jgi:hypothetical protein
MQGSNWDINTEQPVCLRLSAKSASSTFS